MLQEIENLIPHRTPFLFVDEIISFTNETIIGIKTFDERDIWLKGSVPKSEYIPGTILIESMAQCGGAGVRLLGITNGIFGLVSIEDAEFFATAKFTDKIKFVIQNIRLGEKIIKQSGIAYIGDKKIIKATWMCVKIQ
ncbi:3-hydroxyacyl-ACP dehydratase FabZ family protein [Flavobacterium hibernum]|uniref:3-hydroxydecanoyl-ACP dehydratase n=1 Tax=Flavobacterium hibernum TaxID=37752 RepID=A0A0D0EZZ9_9FLAO|nr:3-hydroxyacyl-ACP dehydratase FabZ family protein [Flavobacterium hibernum]KIO54593.1 3-hydroxydecanoyl-ACP dehydratase [Flavobacterium hibernum]OXA84662.1 beta-hydroxyacyl-ACP dehydratase [Flavobacterium hibernum]PTT11988.1 beta-hydroxyacyl-ACP dehydratase [Flavobacterium sp. HMWF030]STO18340.1 (3R)-hydroxymyristoyl-[acyl-carrier-protein] dehydratase [Flavobacterium hibernum]